MLSSIWFIQISTDDEDLKRINQKLKEAPEFKSIKDLQEGKWYRIKIFELVATTKGERVRIQIVDKEFRDGSAYVHLPGRLNGDLVPVLAKFNRKCDSKKPIHIKYNGLKGNTFDLVFDTRKV